MFKIKSKQKLSILMVLLMTVYVMPPCVAQVAPVEYKSVQSIANDAYHGVSSIQPTGTITYFYNGGTLMNAEDDNGDMSTYLGRTVRTIVNINTKTVLDTQCIFTDGKNVISQTDSTGTNITSTQQYNAYGQPVNYNSDTNSQIPKSTNQALSIATNPFQYDGYYYDPESGLYYLNARYYSPALMQFISMDTYDLANRYAYCEGNPIINEDPTGHSDTSFWGQIGLNIAMTVVGIASVYVSQGASAVLAIDGIGTIIASLSSIGTSIGAHYTDGNTSNCLNYVTQGLSLGSSVGGSIGLGVATNAFTVLNSSRVLTGLSIASNIGSSGAAVAGDLTSNKEAKNKLNLASGILGFIGMVGSIVATGNAALAQTDRTIDSSFPKFLEGKGFSKNVNTEVGDFAFVRAKADEFHTQQGIVSITNENGIFNANIRFMDVVPDDFESGLSDNGALKESNNSFKFNKNDFTTIDQILNKHGYRFQLIKKTTVDDLYNISTERYNKTNSYNMLYNNCWQQTRRFAQLA